MNHNYYCLHKSVQRLPRPQFINEEACNRRLWHHDYFYTRELNPTGVGEYIYIYIYIYIKRRYRNCVITPGWRLMRIWYRTFFHTLYDEKYITSLMSSSWLPQMIHHWFRFVWMVCERGSKWSYPSCFVRCCLSSFHQAFSQGVSLKSQLFKCTVVMIQLQDGIIPVLFCFMVLSL